MKDDDEFDIERARAARDEGIGRTSSKNREWLEAYYRFVKTIPPGRVGTAEDIRRIATPVIGEPTSSNCWGAACNGAFLQGFLIKTGKMVQPKAKKSHGRAIQQYRRTGAS
jgi:hypothetical protein